MEHQTDVVKQTAKNAPFFHFIHHDQRTLLNGFAIQLEVDGANHLVLAQRCVQFRVIEHLAGFQIFHPAARDSEVGIFFHAHRNPVAITELDGLRRKLFASFQRGNGFKETETPGEQFFALGFAAFEGASAHHYRNQTHLTFNG